MNNNNLHRLLKLLLLTIVACLMLYYLPDKVFGYKVRKVDLLADIRIKKAAVSLDSFKIQLALADSLLADSIAAIREDTIPLLDADSLAIALRDSLYQVMQSTWNDGDSTCTRFEDFSTGHVGMKHFVAALNKRNTLGRPVRVAFLGDSFIEGDILVADLRAKLQQAYGGHGVGFVPITSQVAQFRPTVEHKFSGWKTCSLLHEKDEAYTLPCMFFEAQSTASVSYKTVGNYPCLQPVSRIQLLYQQNDNTHMRLVCNGVDTLQQELPPATAITAFTKDGTFTEASFVFDQGEGFEALGVVLEDESGVVVDNFSLRGNSGMILTALDKERCRQWNEVRPYDLIVLQYGLNVVSDEVLQYGWYRQQMVKVVKHIQECFPEADILLLSVSDRSCQKEEGFVTMPAVLALLHAQRQIARQTGILFWNVFSAMGGENSMVRYVRNNWAGKDYTHLGFRGGREIANSLFNAILQEKEFYDEAEKTTP